MSEASDLAIIGLTKTCQMSDIPVHAFHGRNTESDLAFREAIRFLGIADRTKQQLCALPGGQQGRARSPGGIVNTPAGQLGDDLTGDHDSEN
jgi:hypothetical protein